jgi:hypothetical protein
MGKLVQEGRDALHRRPSAEGESVFVCRFQLPCGAATVALVDGRVPAQHILQLATLEAGRLLASVSASTL